MYLGLTGIIGYVLLKVTEPSAEKQKQIAATVSSEDRNKKALLMKKLQEASEGDPIYWKNKRD